MKAIPLALVKQGVGTWHMIKSHEEQGKAISLCGRIHQAFVGNPGWIVSEERQYHDMCGHCSRIIKKGKVAALYVEGQSEE